MASVRVSHSAYQLAVGHLMESMRSDGKGLAECAIHTHGGTKVADVAWASRERFEQIKQKWNALWHRRFVWRCSLPATPIRKCTKNGNCILKLTPKKSGTAMRMAD